jgi:hypothetical protein
MVGPVWDVTASGQELVQRCESISDPPTRTVDDRLRF